MTSRCCSSVPINIPAHWENTGHTYDRASAISGITATRVLTSVLRFKSTGRAVTVDTRAFICVCVHFCHGVFTNNYRAKVYRHFMRKN
ncbi:hypothetical protein ATCV1_z050L [Acanthocystis turfacea chlorella virus 1]|uniref:Uncharacterized protein z050L n=1 Tax=Chlorovirus heliozoae TaxID=322019 RepID=A7K810_9PHYC|nr:hypothetical protein ATCV1_z050L [Acanthocystis turfacea chlorella virus 1]ABT16184.1 hypothetical protein ATCV1_z050L [Acanthocystis turfacea chlorella virus 1]